MRITVLGVNYAPEVTGIAPYTTAIAEHLGLHHDVTVVTGIPHYPDWTVPRPYRHWRTTSTASNGVRLIRVRHFVPARPSLAKRALYEASWGLRAAAVARSIPTDAVIAIVPALVSAPAAQYVARHWDAPYGVIVQDIMGSALAQSGIRGGRGVAALATLAENSSLHHAAAVATIHPRLAGKLARLGDRSTPPTVIYNWTHVDESHSSRLDARRRFGWADDEVVAMHSGNMGSKQNLEVLIDAGRRAESAGSRVRFVLAGAGSQRKMLEEYAGNCGQVTFMDGVEEDIYTDLLASADVLLVNERPGMTDMCLPSKMTSYLHAARPMVAATDVNSTTADFVRETGGGIVTSAGNSAGLLETVTALANDQGRSEHLGRCGYRFALDHLSRGPALAAYDDWTDDLLTHRTYAPSFAREMKVERRTDSRGTSNRWRPHHLEVP